MEASHDERHHAELLMRQQVSLRRAMCPAEHFPLVPLVLCMTECCDCATPHRYVLVLLLACRLCAVGRVKLQTIMVPETEYTHKEKVRRGWFCALCPVAHVEVYQGVSQFPC